MTFFRVGKQSLRALIVDGPPEHFIHRFAHQEPFAAGERDDRVGSRLDVLDQFGVEHKCLAAELGQFDHGKRAANKCTDLVHRRRTRSAAG